MVVKFVVFVIILKPSNIFSLIVIMLVFSGVQFIRCLVLPLQQVYLTITPPTSVSHLFWGWSKLDRRKHNMLVLTGASVPVLGNQAHKK